MKAIALCVTDLHLQIGNIPIFESIIKQAIVLCKLNGIRTILNLGDTFTSRKGQPQEVMMAFHRALEELAENNIDMIAIVGNHDKTDYKSADNFLIPFQDHKALTLISECGDIDITEGLRIHGISYFDDEVYRKYLKQINYLKDGVNVCLTHIGVSGAVMNNGISIEGAIKTTDFKKFDHTYIGHYHDYQELKNVVYIGSTFPHNFGENNHKGIYIMYQDGSIERQQTNFPNYVTIEDFEVERIDEFIEKLGDNGDKFRIKTDKPISSVQKARLQQAGIRVAVEKKDAILENNEVVQVFDDKSILETYHEWAKKSKMSKKDIVEGEELLKKVL